MGSMIDTTTRHCRFTADIFQPKRSKTLNPRKSAISAAENTNYPLISITCLAALIAPWSREPQLGPRHRLRPSVARRQREPAHLQYRIAAQPKYPRCLTPTVALDKHKTPNGGIHFHGKHPSVIPKGTNLTNGRVLRRPRQHNADAPMACFVTALHNQRRRQSKGRIGP